jgi:hypothetical protein
VKSWAVEFIVFLGFADLTKVNFVFAKNILITVSNGAE